MELGKKKKKIGDIVRYFCFMICFFEYLFLLKKKKIFPFLNGCFSEGYLDKNSGVLLIFRSFFS